MTRAAMSLPTPLSPVRRTFASDFAAHSTSDRMMLMAGLVPIRLSIVRSTLFPLLRRRAYQPAAKGENAPKVRMYGTYVSPAAERPNAHQQPRKYRRCHGRQS